MPGVSDELRSGLRNFEGVTDVATRKLINYQSHVRKICMLSLEVKFYYFHIKLQDPLWQKEVRGLVASHLQDKG